jgi:hypothetical protein
MSLFCNLVTTVIPIVNNSKMAVAGVSGMGVTLPPTLKLWKLKAIFYGI